ncbi:helix-turn-helix domain-containing protein [bacterium]|nr:helix-turn-helix domain-containing protein [bacterium]
MMHYHYIDSPPSLKRLVLELDHGKLDYPFGSIDLIYGGRIQNPAILSNRMEDANSLVQESLLVLSEVMEAGDVITIELRKKHVLEQIILDRVHELVELVHDSGKLYGMLYWIKAGRTGVCSMKARVVQDKKGAASKIGKIRANMKDHDYRDYLSKQERVGSDVPRREWPQLLTFAEAADYTGFSVSTLRRESPDDLPRIRRKLRKTDLDKFLERKGK